MVSVQLAVSERGLAGGLLVSGQVAVGESGQGHVTTVTETPQQASTTTCDIT